MKLLTGFACLSLSIGPATEALTDFDTQTNEMVDQATHDSDIAQFSEVEGMVSVLSTDAQSCRECHIDPVVGGTSQVFELRVGHHDPTGKFVNPSITVADGPITISNHSLVNSRAICPNADFPDINLQETVPASEHIRAISILAQCPGRRLRRSHCGRDSAKTGRSSVPFNEGKGVRSGDFGGTFPVEAHHCDCPCLFFAFSSKLNALSPGDSDGRYRLEGAPHLRTYLHPHPYLFCRAQQADFVQPAPQGL